MSEGELPVAQPYDETIFSDPALIDGRRIVLHAERPILDTRFVQDRVAVITRRVVVERRTVEIELLREELCVEYRSGDGSEVFEPRADAVRLLLQAEEFEIVKRARVVEEISIAKRSVVERERRPVTLRKEQLETDGLIRAT